MAEITDVARDCIDIHGAQKQLLQLIKEMNEMTTEIFDVLDGKGNLDKVASEMADVKFMLLQTEMILEVATAGKFNKTLEVELKYKVDRQNSRNEVDRKLFKNGVAIDQNMQMQTGAGVNDVQN